MFTRRYDAFIDRPKESLPVVEIVTGNSGVMDSQDKSSGSTSADGEVGPLDTATALPPASVTRAELITGSLLRR